jgi:superfamily II DNA helicase RecQ
MKLIVFSEWGHDFRPEYQKSKNIIKQGDVPIIGLYYCYSESTRGYLENWIWLMPKHLKRRLIDLISIMKFEQNQNIESDIIRFIKQHKENQGLSTV